MIEAARVFLEGRGMDPFWVAWLVHGAAVIGIIVICVLADLITRRVLLRLLGAIITRTTVKWDDHILEQQVPQRLARFVPALVLQALLPLALADYPLLLVPLLTAIHIAIIVIGVRSLYAALNALQAIYEDLPVAREMPIRSVVQFIKLLLAVAAIITTTGLVAGKSPLMLLSGIGAFTAVLMLIFKDAILGFVAGIQLAVNRMVTAGDWIEMPSHGADGDVLDVSLTTVKVQNWDKTITTIPTYALISHSFKNWRGMQESGGRRIKRAINIDLTTVRFCDEESLKRYSRIQYIQEYLTTRREEITRHNAAAAVDDASLVNGRRLTNIGTFRAYVEAYLQHHPLLNRDMTFMVRQLAPTEHGLPIEIYVFSSDKVWAHYEAIQADIFDHILAAVPEFDLRVYQQPSGNDFRSCFVPNEDDPRLRE